MSDPDKRITDEQIRLLNDLAYRLLQWEDSGVPDSHLLDWLLSNAKPCSWLIPLLASEYERLQAENASLVPAWIPVSKQIPGIEDAAEDHLVVIRNMNFSFSFVSMRQYMGSGEWEGLADDSRVTHWMPLPPLPAEEVK